MISNSCFNLAKSLPSASLSACSATFSFSFSCLISASLAFILFVIFLISSLSFSQITLESSNLTSVSKIIQSHKSIS